MKYDCVFVNGDSYSAPATHQVYGDFLSKQLGIPVKNYALPGSNNQRIIRSSIEYLDQLKSTYQNPLIIIGWTFIRRLETWYHGNNDQLLSRMHDHADSRLITVDWLVGSNEITLEQKALINDEKSVPKLLIDFYTNLYMFAHTLQSHNLNYLFFSAANNSFYPVADFPYLASLHQVKWVVNNPNIYQLDKFNISNWAHDNDADCNKKTGHLSETGHEKFAMFMLENLIH